MWHVHVHVAESSKTVRSTCTASSLKCGRAKRAITMPQKRRVTIPESCTASAT